MSIDYITNVTSFATIDATGTWNLPGFPSNIDEVVIRQVTYNSIAATKSVLLIYSSLGNKIIAAVANTAGFTSNPDTRIRITNPISNTITFQLFVPALIPIPVDAAAAGDQICISMDFIKYKK